MQFGKVAKAFVDTAVIDEPKLSVYVVDAFEGWKATHQRGDSGNRRISAANKTAGMTWMPSDVRHCPLFVGAKPTSVPVDC
jgi:hypothetical protein